MTNYGMTTYKIERQQQKSDNPKSVSVFFSDGSELASFMTLTYL